MYKELEGAGTSKVKILPGPLQHKVLLPNTKYTSFFIYTFIHLYIKDAANSLLRYESGTLLP